jgi:23S rRNA pseudouridine1911/1915/1917 synthase
MQEKIKKHKETPMHILYEDSHILVVWKPAGMESQESRGFGADMVSEIRKFIHSRSPGPEVPYVGVIHRLDKPVSGILVYARTKKAAASLSKQLAEQRVKKDYLAVLCGKPVDNVDKFVDYLLKDSRTNRSSIVDKGITGAKRAALSYEILESRVVEPYGALSLARITLETGRHHQIRVQMAGHGLPLWGDQKYHPGGSFSAGQNLALAAWKLSFVHPGTGKQMNFEQLPEEGIFRQFRFVTPC